MLVKDYENLIKSFTQTAETSSDDRRVHGWLWNATQKKLHAMNCGSRYCETCSSSWAHKWRAVLNDYDKTRASIPTPRSPGVALRLDKAMTLTTAYNVDYQKLWLALKMFWRDIRKDFGRQIEYFAVVEYNSKQTQPHIHFTLVNAPFIPSESLKRIWIKAQKSAKFEKIAWVTYIKAVKKGLAAYYTKYITKATNNSKNEIPPRALWRGRSIRYSRKFFRVPVGAIVAALKFAASVKHKSFDTYYPITKQPHEINFAIDICEHEYNKKCKVARALWDPVADRARAKIESEELVLCYT